MRIGTAVLLFFLIIAAVALQAQTSAPAAAPPLKPEESIDSSGPPAPDTAASSTTTTAAVPFPTTPGWAKFVRIAATGGPIAFLLLAWLSGVLVHYRLVRREQAQFPVNRGSRTPQTVPMVISAALFFIPTLLFIIFEVRSRIEIRRGIGGVVDEWHPVTAHAWTSLVICMVLALVPWLFARRADTIGQEG
jgi:hypothetical protein